MTDYIEREAALNFIANVECRPSELEAVKNALQVYSDHISSLPAADVQPVVHGKWEAQCPDLVPMGSTWYCSNCDEEYDEWGCKPPWRFCPYCGARMDLEDTE